MSAPCVTIVRETNTYVKLTDALARNISNRVLAMIRGSLVTLIFRKTLRLNMDASNETDAITLMTADIDRIMDNVNSFHDVYIAVIEFPLSIWLLFRLLGWPVSVSVVYATGKAISSVSSFDSISLTYHSFRTCRNSPRRCSRKRPRTLARSHRNTPCRNI